MAQSILKLKVDSGEYEGKIKRAAQGLQNLGMSLKSAGKSFADADKDQVAFIQELGRMETVTKSAKGSIGEMTKAFVDLKTQYNQLSEAEKASQPGKALIQSLDQLKGRIVSAKQDLKNVEAELSGQKFGQFGSIIDGIGQKMGISANLTDLMTSKTALLTTGVGALATAVSMAVNEWAKYNAELARQDQITTVTTGLDGKDAERMTDAARALSQTYNVDFREAINAANTLMSQFGETGDSAIQLLRDGMQGMLQGDGGKLLSMIQQYAPAFRDAGVSASQLVAVIQNSEGGIFTDQNMNAIVMGIKNIRLMTKATSEALAQLGIDGEEMTKKLNEGTITIFDALKLVSTQLKKVDSNSQAAGQVMQAVFGRQGAMAGTNLAKAIETLNLNLEETKKQTGEVGEAYDELYQANKRLSEAIRECFGWDGWKQMSMGIKTEFIRGLAIVLEYASQIKNNVIQTIRYLRNLPTEEIVLPDVEETESPYRLHNNIIKDVRRIREEARQRIRHGQVEPTTKTTLHNTTTKSQQAEASIKAAELEYQRALEKAALELESGRITSAELKNKEFQAVERLWESYGKAYDIYANPKYKERQEALSEDVKKLGGEVTASVEAQKLAQEAARELAATQKKVSDALEEAAKAYQDNNLKGYISSMKKVGGDYIQGIANGNFTFTNSNLNAFIETLKEQLSQADLGSTLYNNLTAQLADATALGNLMQTAIKNGIDIAQFAPQDLWTKVFGENPGDYIDDSTWQKLVEKINEELAKRGIIISLDTLSGGVSSANSKKNPYIHEDDGKSYAKVNEVLGGLASGVGQIVSGIEQLGIEIPDEMKSVINGMQGISTILTGIATTVLAIQAIQGVGLFKPWATGGIVHAAGGWAGFVPGNTYSVDAVPALLESGELVLNRAQQGVLANELQEGGARNITISGVLSGEDIVLVADRWGRRTGAGELLFAKNL
jgi:Phage-related minor tail protein.